MINKDSFIKIMDTLDDFFNGDISKAFDLLGFYDNRITNCMDVVLGAIDKDIDPQQLAAKDENCAPCGSFLYEWLFGDNEFQEICPTAESLYDYIAKKYETAE